MVLAQRLALVTLIATFILIGVGVLVRATGSGLGCPDWPLCHGQAIPPTESHHTLIEFSHRMVASLVGFLVIGLAIISWRTYPTVARIRWTTIVIVPLVGIQGLIGAIVVYRELPAEIVATHLVLAMVIVGLMLATLLMMYAEDPGRERAMTTLRERVRPTLGTIVVVAMIWLVLVMWIGAYTSESGASTACEGWPLCSGNVFPEQEEHQVVHMVHRYLAAGFAIPLGMAMMAAWRRRQEIAGATAWTLGLGALYLAQVLLGAFNVWYTFPDTLTIAHTMVATSIWLLLAGAAIVAYYRPAAGAASRPLSREVPA